jgi:hypothetical protein
MKTSEIIYLALCTFCLVATNGYYYTYGGDNNFSSGGINSSAVITYNHNIKDIFTKNAMMFNLDPVIRGGIGFAKYGTLNNEYLHYKIYANGLYYSIYKISKPDVIKTNDLSNLSQK